MAFIDEQLRRSSCPTVSYTGRTQQPPFNTAKMSNTDKETSDILQQVLQEYGSRISIQYNANILVSDPNVARTIYDQTASIRNTFGPKIVIASRGEADPDVSGLEHVTVKSLESLEMDQYTHAIFCLSNEDPKVVLKGLQWMIHALQPKGIAIVTSLKVEAGKVEGEEGQFNVGLEEKMLFQSKGKIGKLTEVLEYAGFERGKIRSHERSTEAGGGKTDAEVVLAMKWDQLTG
ncbi:uncharacterized protein LTR77_003171 [Saxophila tyrrhenica]|uniref:Methyltransferase type 11 domain-containing protein n=1 Tax=Saxophila tyrrhenica TaxID=1690608 RepID=A0AAV9PH27_9PEZI|nr:hypothetical protein LTR77_003171 [Saxophila tyrrhenica]